MIGQTAEAEGLEVGRGADLDRRALLVVVVWRAVMMARFASDVIMAPRHMRHSNSNGSLSHKRAIACHVCTTTA